MGKSFEEIIRESLQNYEVDYDPAGWEEMNSLLDQQQVVGPKKTGWLKGGLFLGGLVVVGLLIYQFGINKKTESGNETIASTELQSKELQLKTDVDQEKAPITSADVRDESAVGVENQDKSETSNPKVKGEENEENKTLKTSTKNQKEDDRNHKLVSKDLEKETVKEGEDENESLEIAKQQKIEADFAISRNKVCNNEEVIMSANKLDCPKCTFTWDLGDGTVQKGEVIRHQYEYPGMYTVELTAKHGDQVNTSKEAVQILQTPNGDFNVELVYENDLPRYLFTYTGDPVKTIKWSFDDGTTYNKESFTKPFYQEGSYELLMEVVNNQECKMSKNEEIRINKVVDILAPTAFSPNGDGRNDDWLPAKLLDGTFEVFDLNIYNRSKHLVFSTSSSNNPWKGQLAGRSENAKAGETYVWTAQVRDESGVYRSYHGSIVITKH